MQTAKSGHKTGHTVYLKEHLLSSLNNLRENRKKMASAGMKDKKNTLFLRRQTLKAFKLRGLTLQSSACDAILNVLNREDKSDHNNILNTFAEDVKERTVRSSQGGNIVTQDLILEIIAEQTRDEQDYLRERLQLLNAFEMPRLNFNIMRRKFSLLNNPKKSIFGDAEDKVDMMIQRFTLVQQRVLRQECFRPKLVTSDNYRNSAKTSTSTTKITPVESLIGRSGPRNLLGMIVQVEEGRYYLEDLTGQIPLDLRDAQVLSDGLIGENSIVLVEGEMRDTDLGGGQQTSLLCLHVDKVGSPPPETREESLIHIGLQNSNIFSAFSSETELNQLEEEELKHGQDNMFVVLSDVHLDKPSVLTKLETLFEGFADMEPLPIFIFMGNFTSTPIRSGSSGSMRGGRGANQSSSNLQILAGYFDQLAKIILQYPRIAQEARFVFVPGPLDQTASAGCVLPQPPLPTFFSSRIKQKIPHAIFATNPCRIRFFTKEFVFFRQDIIGKLRQNCIIQPRSQDDDGYEDDTIMEEDEPQDKKSSRMNVSERLVDHAVQTIM